MRVIPTSSSLHVYWQQLTYTEAALLARPETTPHAAPTTALLDEYEALRPRDFATQRSVIRSQARAAASDADVDAVTRDLHNDVLHATGQDRGTPLFRAFFKSDIATMVRFALKKQLEVAAQLVQALGLSIVPAALRERYLPRFTEVTERGHQALGERTDAARERTEVRLDIDEFKADVNAARLSLYGALLGHAAKHRLPKSWAASFFMRARTRSAGASDLDLEVEPEPEPELEIEDVDPELDEA